MKPAVIESGKQRAAQQFAVVVCGSLNLDLVSRLDRLPRPGETLAARDLLQLPGGKGLNQAVAAARMGCATAMIGACGEDEPGAKLLALLQQEGVDIQGVQRRSSLANRAGTGTGLAEVWLAAEGENSIVIHPGANASLTREDARSSPKAAVYLAQLETPIAAVAEFFVRGKSMGARCLLNAAPASPAARELLPLIDILIVNETEHEQLAAGALLRADQSIVLTEGANGVTLIQAAATHHWPAHEVEAIDTTGAGDCFCGVLAASLAAGIDLSQAIRRANVAAALSVTRLGAAPAMPRAHEVDSHFGA